MTGIPFANAPEMWLRDDPQHLVFTLARYKHTAKLLAGRERVLEVGCASGFAAPIVRQHVQQLTCADINPDSVRMAAELTKHDITFIVHDFITAPTRSLYDAAYALDVIEHITPKEEHLFLGNIVDSLTDDGILIIGSPTLESQAYASDLSREGHVNCKTISEWRSLMDRYFTAVFALSMNDETLHTGFAPMSHYCLVVGCVPRVYGPPAW